MRDFLEIYTLRIEKKTYKGQEPRHKLNKKEVTSDKSIMPK